MDTETPKATYHARVRAQGRVRREQHTFDQRSAKRDAEARDARARNARARSAKRWADTDARGDQARRAGRLELIVGDDRAEAELGHAS